MSGASSLNEAASPSSIEQKIASEPLVSIVTPFYNTHEFLEECIESVLRQTYRNWEYVLVNNCSTDGSSEIAAKYQSQYPDKIRLIHTESFLSQVQNYNFSLNCISPNSKYCKMVQADDWLFPDCISEMIDLAEAHPSVGIVAAYRLEGAEIQLGGLPYPSPEVPGRDACRLYFLKNKYLFGSPTSVLFRAQAIRLRLPFFEERYAPFEDGHVCFELLQTWNFGFVHQVLTFSRWNDDGIMPRAYTIGLELFLRFSMLVAHGQAYLSPQEYADLFRNARCQYFLFLTKAACAFHPETKTFWDFHRNGLAAIGYKFDWKTILIWLPRALVEKAWGAFWRIWDGNPPLSKVTG
jgi:glycosyltransferase involved in cell wall biosynthesis